MPKFMQTLDERVHSQLKEMAEARGITIQEFIRAVIIPEWLNASASFTEKAPGSY